jgi:mono/diheme cytochrome c family protein
VTARVILFLSLVLAALAIAGCDGAAKPADPIERGRFIYLERCVVCHNRDPNLAGPQGPPIAGASHELIEDRVLHLTYPPGYTPKRNSHAMLAMPDLAPEIDNLTAFLQSAAAK